MKDKEDKETVTDQTKIKSQDKWPQGSVPDCILGEK
jgi:hypothetical protein